MDTKKPGAPGRIPDSEFQKLVEQYEKLVFTILYSFVKDYHEAQNLCQDTFVSAYLHLDSCTGKDFKPWLARIATNKAKDFLGSAYHRRVTPSQETPAPAQHAPPPEELFLQAQGAREIKDKILALREPYRLVSIAYFLEQKEVNEIAKALGRPPKTVHTQLARARAILQKQLEEGA